MSDCKSPSKKNRAPETFEFRPGFIFSGSSCAKNLVISVGFHVIAPGIEPVRFPPACARAHHLQRRGSLSISAMRAARAGLYQGLPFASSEGGSINHKFSQISFPLR